jgi:hypothetical protein
MAIYIQDSTIDSKSFGPTGITISKLMLYILKTVLIFKFKANLG